MKLWIIADTHFNHENIKRYQGRPEDFNEQIIRNWNKLVSHDDVVIHLGDVILGHDQEKTLPSIMATLPGKKILCRGNHDPKPAQWYMERGFDFACDFFVYQDIAFSHAPLTPLPFCSLSNNPQPVSRNIHGHFHRPKGDLGKVSAYPDKYYDSTYYRANRGKYILAHIEDTLSPVLLEEVLQEFKK
jgi:calcineurin-like phosphoesterase family protein